MIKDIRKLVKKETPKNDYKYHISKVVKYSKILSKMHNEDKKLTEIAALLHDIGGVRKGWEDHEKTGAVESEKILKRLKFPKKDILKIKHCILTHRANKKNFPKTKLAWIVRDADKLSHFDSVPWLIHVGLYRNNNDMKKASGWVKEKLNRDYKTLHFKESKIIAKEKYKKAKVILNKL